MARSTSINAKAKFECACSGVNEDPKSDKDSSASLSPFSIVPNPEMLEEIVKEKDRLRSTAIFFSAVELDKCLPRNFMDDKLFHNYWNLKLGFHISF